QRVALRGRPSRVTGGFSIANGSTCVDCRQSTSIWKNDSAAVSNSLWINGAMTLPETRAGRGFVLPGLTVRAATAVRPVDSDASKQRIVAREAITRPDQADQNEE